MVNFNNVTGFFFFLKIVLLKHKSSGDLQWHIIYTKVREYLSVGSNVQRHRDNLTDRLSPLREECTLNSILLPSLEAKITLLLTNEV